MSERYCKDCRYCHHANIGLLCMGQKGMPHTSPYGSCDSWKSAKQTNADRIRQMTDEELSAFLGGIADNCSYNTCDNCPMCGACVDVPLSRDKWLKQEVKTDD